MLTAVFKDYLIYDDIYEFLDAPFKYHESASILSSYAQNMNQIATVKYGYKEHSYRSNHENIVNRPSVLNRCK